MGDVTNTDRADFARSALEAFQADVGTDDCDAVCDLLCDIMHLCEAEPETFGEFLEGLNRAEGHYEYEKEHDDA